MGKLGHFQSQKSPRAGKPPILPIFVCYSPWIFGSSRFQTPFFLKFFMDVRQETYLCSQLVPTGKPAHCQGKRIPGVGKPTSMDLLVIQISDVIFAKNFFGHLSRT
ncbi:hypothetical protein H5410_056592 [Solanum commersonii]|uniref:Uncharacterized protein n=1 Tax=Solanum commersonii TaxID=4109 RepID=A0A9J5WLR5_SOLCO|nr:hypothetical protein H5410_056592 [Solanum commersonii]